MALNALRENPKQERTVIQMLQDDRVQKGLAVVAGQYMKPDRMLRLCINAVKKTPLLMQCDPQTVLGAFMTAASLDLEPNTVLGQAYLIPYKRNVRQGSQWTQVYECQFQIGYRGFTTLMGRCPEIAGYSARAIHQGDDYDYLEGTDCYMRFRMALTDRGPLIGAYSLVKFASGEPDLHVMPLDEIHKIRERSETYRYLRDQSNRNPEDQKAQNKLAETPWVAWEDQMAAKSVIKRHAKILPLGGSASQIAAAAELDSLGDAGALRLEDMTDPDMAREIISGELDPPKEDPPESGDTLPEIPEVHADHWTQIRDAHKAGGLDQAQLVWSALPAKAKQALQAHFDGLVA